jgi:hypothetical protein
LILILKVCSAIPWFNSVVDHLSTRQLPTFLALGVSLRARGVQFSGLRLQGGDSASVPGTSVAH